MATAAQAGIKAPDSAQGVLEAIEGYFNNGWTDGLPVVPATKGAVDAMLAAAGRNPTEELGEVAPRMGIATVESVAVNAVLAGCKPEYFPVVLAAVEAILEPTFNLNGVQATTNPCAPLVIVSGAIVKELGFNWGYNCFGQGNRANATVGRALRLVMSNIGGGHPGTGDKSTLGQPAKYTFCVAESPDSPWEPLHVERGLSAQESGVTVFACTYHVGSFGGGGDEENKEAALKILQSTAEAVIGIAGEFAVSFGGQLGLVFNPYNAEVLAKNGWTKQGIKQYLYEKARVPMSVVHKRLAEAPGGTLGSRGVDEERWPQWLNGADDAMLFPLIRKPENYIIICCGDVYRAWSALLAGWGYMGGYAHSRPIRKRQR